MQNNIPGNAENNMDAYWDSVRNRNSDHSFPAVANWIREMNKGVARSRLEKRKRRRKSGWLVLAIFPLVFILSCTIRVDRIEKSGNLVNFSIDKKDGKSIQKLSSLQKVFSFTCYEFLQPERPAMAFFIFFIPNKEKEKLLLIIQELKGLNGLQKLDISSINSTVRESLFSTFWHKTLKLGKQQAPKKEELTRNIQATLKDKGLDFLSISISNDKERDIAFIAASPKQDSITIATTTIEKQNDKNDKIRSAPATVDKLQIFNWLLGSWKVKYVSQTYHHWVKVNDSLLMCFIIKYKEEGFIKYGDDGPDISIGFSISYSSPDSTKLSLRGIEWTFLSANDKEINFKNETTPKSANVKWSLDHEKKTWQSVISGEKNLEVVNLMRDKDTDLDNVVKEFIAKHSDVIKKAHD
jgi:hypothetical protein